MAQTNQLRLHLFFAVAEIVVSDDGDDDAGFVAAGQLEGVAAVVNFVLFFPTHPIAALAFRGLVEMRQADGFFRHLNQMRREDDAAGVAGPMFAVERGVIFRQQRVAAVFKNRFDEIEIANEVARHEETDFHRFLFREAGNFGADERTQQQRDETFRRLRLRGGEGQFQQVLRRRERELEDFGKGDFRHAKLIVGNRQAALGDVENTHRRAPVAFGVVQNALFDAVGIDDVGGKILAVHWQREHAGEAGAVERKGACGEFWRGNLL